MFLSSPRYTNDNRHYLVGVVTIIITASYANRDGSNIPKKLRDYPECHTNQAQSAGECETNFDCFEIWHE